MEKFGDFSIFSHGSQVRYKVELEEFLKSETFLGVAACTNPFAKVFEAKIKVPFSVARERYGSSITAKNAGKCSFKTEIKAEFRDLIARLPEEDEGKRDMP